MSDQAAFGTTVDPANAIVGIVIITLVLGILAVMWTYKLWPMNKIANWLQHVTLPTESDQP